MDAPPLRVLLVDDDEDDCLLVREILREIPHQRYDVTCAPTYEAGLDRVAAGGFDVCLVDYCLGARSGLDLLREARARGCRVPIVLLTGQGDRSVDLQAMEAGAADFLVKGQIPASLVERSIRYAIERKRSEEALQRANAQLADQIVELERLKETLRQQAIRDPLTGLFNRRYLEESLDREILRGLRRSSPIGVIMLDMDGLKPYNDAYGHGGGDALLRALGSFLRSHIRGEDIACRYGGDEFCLILPDAALEQTAARAEQLRVGAKQVPIEQDGRELGRTTFSLGVSAFPNHGKTGEAILRAADGALYAAKSAGRDRVVTA
jgi:diguanylate cyclase (GGDEF)-like protein